MATITPKVTKAAVKRLLLQRARGATRHSPCTSRPTAAIAAQQLSERIERRNAGGRAAPLLLVALLLCADAETDARCELLSRMDASNRRHTGTSPQKRSAGGKDESDESKCDQQQQQTTYFDAEYETTGLVGAGSFGMVLQCVSKRDGRVAAVKMVQDLADSRDEVAREKAALARVQQRGGHDAIVRFDGAYAHNGFHYIVTEFIAGESLHAFLEKRRHVDVREALQLVAQLADALEFLQQSGIVHCDLKPENIMVLSDGDGDGDDMRNLKLKIIDFGSAGPSEVSDSAPQNPPAIALSGTRCYWSPEALLRQEMTPAMDMWALGCLLYILISGRHPFDLMGSSSEEQIVQRVVACESVSFVHPAWASVPSDVKVLVRGLLEKDPRARLSVGEVLAHVSVQRACSGD